ncbi:hypothetical protein [Pseudomonas sp. 008]|uniref:hypothetical protein n=1 Tax=Pseudomonas sp. 008 TaxID=2803906 RepID=UPI001950CC4E|nr:hypothetical protein [Pseudomonas sp. 008]GID05204.1 hypothetical protein TMM008_24060 [Pseudomonas sp. 008]
MNTSFLQLRLSQGINAKSQELLPATSGFLLFFCLFTGYFMLRPIREFSLFGLAPCSHSYS